jgi:hypothetical protein
MSATVTKIDGFAGVNEARKRFVRLHAGETIAKGDCVAIHVLGTTYGAGNTVLRADQGDVPNKLVVGVAAETITSGEFGNIQVSGVCDFAKILDTADAPGDILCASSTGGSLTKMDVSSTHADLPCAILLVEGTANTADSTVLLLNPCNY